MLKIVKNKCRNMLSKIVKSMLEIVKHTTMIATWNQRYKISKKSKRVKKAVVAHWKLRMKILFRSKIAKTIVMIKFIVI